MRTPSRFRRRYALLMLPWLLVAGAADQHLGVASCAGSTCHAATQPFPGHTIRQDEYFVWQRKDRHAQAYNALLTPRGQKIATTLGWGDAAKADGCLACHADNVPSAGRGERFQLSDGVGCEACHGGAERWIAPHVQGFKSVADASAHGMTATWVPQQRATLCLSCHQGDSARPMTHAIMAAGHPPLLFELDTFTTLQPAHFVADARYVQRKGAVDAAQNWLVGQTQAADLLLNNLVQMPQRGLFPELAYFDCNACHHSMFAGRAASARVTGQSVGTVPLADSALLMLSHWLTLAIAPLAQQWRDDRAQLYAAVAHGDAAQLRRRAQTMRTLLNQKLIPLAPTALTDSAQVRRLMAQIISEDLDGLSGDFSHAQQTAMAITVLFSSLQQHNSADVTPSLQRAVNALYAAVNDRDHYAPAAFRNAVQSLRETLRLK